MLKKIFLVMLLIFSVSCSPLSASEYIDTILPGKWNIEGTSFVEKNFVRVSFKIEGTMNQSTDILKNINADIDKVIEDNKETSRNIVNENRRVLTSCDINLRLYIFDKAGFDIKVWDNKIDNAVNYPVLLPEARPTLSNPFSLPAVKIQDLNLTVTFTSESSGKLRVQGYADLDTVGVCEINADCALWRDGTAKPAIEEETNSGCNAGLEILSAIAALLIFGRSKKFCSARI